MDFEILVDEHSHNGHNGHDGQIPAHRPTSPEPTAHLAVRDSELLVEDPSQNGQTGHDGQIPAPRPTSPEPPAPLAVRDSEVPLCVEPVDDLRPVGGGHLHAGDVTWCWVCKATAET